MNWAVKESMIKWINAHIPKGRTILELGSGDGTTARLCNDYVLYSVEHDSKWIGRYNSNYIKTRMFMGWYYLADDILPKEYDLLIIDGPIGNSRVYFINYFDFFRKDVPIIIDDSAREGEQRIIKFLIGLNYHIVGEDTTTRTKQWVVMEPTERRLS